MLGVSLAAILLASLLMILILSRYGFKANAKLAALRPARSRGRDPSSGRSGDIVSGSCRAEPEVAV